jgi:oligopeptidase B
MRVAAADSAGGRAKWTDLVPHSADVFIEDFKPFDRFIAIAERSGGNKRLRLLPGAGKSSFVASDEPAYAMDIDINREPESDWLRYRYNSLTTPSSVYEVNAGTGERRLLKQTPAPGYDPSKYVTERLWATARDGTKIPVSLVYR